MSDELEIFELKQKLKDYQQRNDNLVKNTVRVRELYQDKYTQCEELIKSAHSKHQTAQDTELVHAKIKELEKELAITEANALGKEEWVDKYLAKVAECSAIQAHNEKLEAEVKVVRIHNNDLEANVSRKAENNEEELRKKLYESNEALVEMELSKQNWERKYGNMRNKRDDLQDRLDNPQDYESEEDKESEDEAITYDESDYDAWVGKYKEEKGKRKEVEKHASLERSGFESVIRLKDVQINDLKEQLRKTKKRKLSVDTSLQTISLDD